MSPAEFLRIITANDYPQDFPAWRNFAVNKLRLYNFGDAANAVEASPGFVEAVNHLNLEHIGVLGV